MDLGLISLCITVVLLLWVIFLSYKYFTVLKKLGNGENLDKMLGKYITEVKNVKKDNDEIINYYTKLDADIENSIQKVGLVRYNAFKDVGSDLSFALALLDRENNGIVLNGIYGSESSNIYAKPIKSGTSTYQLSNEEKSAIDMAIQANNVIIKQRTSGK